MCIRKNIIISIILVLLTGNIYCQAVKMQQITQLATLGKVWGFLKYYHPIVSQGAYNWDTALVANFNKALTAKNKFEFNTLLYSIIQSAGTVPSIPPDWKKAPDSLAQNLSMKWLNDTSVFSPTISRLLWHIFTNYKPCSNFYIARRENIGNAYFPNENPYTVVLPSIEYRFLALCRFWNVINYYYPYKYMIPGSWDSVLPEFIPRMINIESEYSYYRTIQEMITRLKDGHAMISSSWGNQFADRKLLPFLVQRMDSVFIVNREIDTSHCLKEDIHTGDTILSIDNVDAFTLFKHHERFQSASNQNYLENKASLWMSIVKKDTINVTFSKNKDTLYKSIQTLPPPLIIHSKYTTSYKLINDSVGFLNFGKLQIEQVDSAFQLFRQTKYIIADCRNYPKWTLLAIAEIILPKRTLITQVCEPDFKNPGYIKWAKPMFAGSKNNHYYKGKFIVLINYETMSQAELTVLVLKKAPQCITIGTQTAGALGDISILPLPGGIKINYSGLGYYFPDYSMFQQKGIMPDIEVKPSYPYILNGKDEIFERALEYVQYNR